MNWVGLMSSSSMRITQRDRAYHGRLDSPLAQDVHTRSGGDQRKLMHTDLLITWAALFGTVMLLAYSTSRR
jgi:hypothetical protein